MLRSRYRRIVLFFARVFISTLYWELMLPRIGFRKLAQTTRPERLKRIAVRFRLLAIDMGGVLIKVGQFLSARVDVLPAEITDSLAGLQDEVPPEEFSAIRSLVEAEFGAPLFETFTEFSETPEAAASLGQVHRARVQASRPVAGQAERSAEVEGMEVVVKVQRPKIETIIATDLAALRTVGNWLERYPPISRRADVPALMGEFTRILYAEIDYLAEGRNAETFAANFKRRKGVRVPAVIWTHTTRRVLALEQVGGIKISGFEAIANAGINRAEVAARLFDTYLKQIFEDGFFHADPHPGNIFVTPTTTPDRPGPDGGLQGEAEKAPGWQLTFVDFGMVGRVPANIRAGIREMVIAIGTRDSGRMVKSFQLLGVLLPHADLSLLEKAEAKAFERFWGKSMQELMQISHQEVWDFSREFRELIYTMPFQIPQDLILLGRMVGILSGICTGLNPRFNVWEGLEPYAQKLIAEEVTSQAKVWLEEIGSLARSLFVLPRRLEALVDKAERGDLSVRDPYLSGQVRNLERATTRIAISLVFSGLLIGGIQLYLAGNTVFGWLLLAMATVSLGWVVFSRRN